MAIQYNKRTDFQELWSEIDGTDWKREYRGIITRIADERGTSRQSIWNALFRNRSIEIGVIAIRLKRERQRLVAEAMR